MTEKDFRLMKNLLDAGHTARVIAMLSEELALEERMLWAAQVGAWRWPLFWVNGKPRRPWRPV